MKNLENRTFDEIEVGAAATFSHTLTQPGIELLALVSGDVDPFHVQPDDAPEGHAEADTIDAAAAAALISMAIGTKLPGPGSHIRRQDLRYRGTISAGDTLTASVVAREKRAEDREILFDCQCTNQDGVELAAGVVTVSAPAVRIRYLEIAPPQLTLRRRDVFARLIKACEAFPPVPCAIAHPCDRDALLGPVEAARRKMIRPFLIGPEEKIRQVAATEGIDISPCTIVPVAHSHAAAEKAVEMARSGEVEALMKGSLHTDELMAAVVRSETGLRTSRRISHVFVMDVPAYDRPLLITDAAINIFPKLEDKVGIIQNAIDLAQVLGIVQPRVAILSAVETVTPRIPSTIDAAALCKMADRGQIKGGVLDGPLAFDNAISAAAAQTKGIISPVAGRADILLAPDLEAGNILAKQLSYLAGAEGAGVVLGTRVPIVLTSRADSVRTRLASIAVMVLVAAASSREPGSTAV